MRARIEKPHQDDGRLTGQVVRAVLLDVGGTLWPNRWPEGPDQEVERVAAMRDVEPKLSYRDARSIVVELSAWRHPPDERQRTVDVVRDALVRLSLSGVVDPANVIAAMSLPARGRVEPFRGARRLLETLHEHQVRVVLATNVLWRTGESQFDDLHDFGLSRYVAACVTSLDVGWRKPHARFFSALLRSAGCAAANCVMVGDSESNDILPARDLGMRTIKVAIERYPVDPTVASHVCRSLDEVTRQLETAAALD